MSGKLDGCSYAGTLKNFQSTHIGYRAHRAVIFAIAWHLVLGYALYKFTFYLLTYLLPERIEYKVGAMVYQCLHGQAPRYLADNLIPASGAASRRLRLRSANRNCLTVPRCRLSTYGCRAFDYAGPTVGNSLPDKLRNSDSFDNFKRFRKTLSLVATVQRIRGYFITRCPI